MEKERYAEIVLNPAAIIQLNLYLIIPPDIQNLSLYKCKVFEDPLFNTKNYEAYKTIDFFGVPIQLKFLRTVRKDGSQQIYIFLADDPTQMASCRIDLNEFGGLKDSKIIFNQPDTKNNIFKYIFENLSVAKIDKEDPNFVYLQDLKRNAALMEKKNTLPKISVESMVPPREPIFVNQGNAVSSNEQPLVTAGLNTCTAIAFSYGGKNFLSHVDATTNPMLLIDSISKNFDLNKLKSDPDFKIHLFYGDSGNDGSYLVIMKALDKLGLINKAYIANELTTFTQTIGIGSSGAFSYK